MSRLKVLHFGKYYPPVPGGMERVLQLLCEHEQRHVDVQVLVSSLDRRTTRERVNGVAVTRVGRVAAIGSVGVSPGLPSSWREPPPTSR